jgi:DNA (cytosine-5)-methyltransferase 1
MRFGSLFAGIGGFDLGFERAGMECAWQVEIDEYCNKVLAKHWPEVKRYGDIRTVGEHNLEPVDLICGGFPCQPYSVAGKRKGAEDDRNLWPEYLRIVRELRPTWVVGENVPGIVPMYLDQVLSDLEGEAYTCWTFNIPACAFDAPHRRERIFVVAYRERMGREAWFSKAVQSQKQEPKRQGADNLRQAQPGAGDVAYTTEQRLEGQITTRINGREQGLLTECSWWTTEPRVGRVADGVPARVDRLRALRNAVVPQVAEFIGRRIMEVENR